MSVKKLLGAFFLAALASGLSMTWAQGGVPEGKKAFESRKCAACHQAEGPAREKTIKDQLSKKGPELWYTGSKLKKEFLEAWLKDPRPIRPLEYNSLTKKNAGGHPMLDGGEAAEVTEYLMSLKSGDVRALGIRPEDNTKGKIIFIKKLACYGCHEVRVRGNAAGGLSGPSFAGAGLRLQPDWIYAYLSNPKAFKPVKDMPNYDKALKDDEVKALASYVASFN